MPADLHATDQAQGLRQAFRRPGLAVLPVCAPGRDAASQGWIVHLAAALAERGLRVLVLDADRGHVAPAFGLKARRELRDLLEGDCEFDDAVLEAVPGCRVLAGARGLALFHDSGEAPARLLDAFLALDPAPEVLLANGPLARVAPLVAAGAEVLLVASPAPEALTGVYAALKRLERDFPGRVPRIAVAGAESEAAGEAIAARLARAAQRFLGRSPAFAPATLDDDALREAERLGRSLLAHAPQGAAAASFRRVALAFDEWRAERHEPAGTP
jgi:flagellar biosynthesis protein FlhG